MADRNSWDDFMLKEYEEAWTYIRYTYDTSNRMLWYAFAIIVAIGAVLARALVETVETTVGMTTTTSLKMRNLSMMEHGESYPLGFIFIVLFLIGLCIHAFYVFQRVIVARQLKVIDWVRQYFINQANGRVDLEPYLYFRLVPIPEGTKDIIAQTRLMLPVFVNALTGMLMFVFFAGWGWDSILSIVGIFVVWVLSQFLLINSMAYRALEK